MARRLTDIYREIRQFTELAGDDLRVCSVLDHIAASHTAIVAVIAIASGGEDTDAGYDSLQLEGPPAGRDEPSGLIQEPPATSWAEHRWPYLSPQFRETHNRLRILRGLLPIPEPEVCRYGQVPPDLDPKHWSGGGSRPPDAPDSSVVIDADFPLDEDDDRIRRVLEAALEFDWQIRELQAPDGVLQWRRRVAEMRPECLAAIEVLRGMIDTAEFSHPMLAWWALPKTEVERTGLVMAVPRDQAQYVPLSAEHHRRELDLLVDLFNGMASAPLNVVERRQIASAAGAEKAALGRLAAAIEIISGRPNYKPVANLAAAVLGREVSELRVRDALKAHRQQST